VAECLTAVVEEETEVEVDESTALHLHLPECDLLACPE